MVPPPAPLRRRHDPRPAPAHQRLADLHRHYAGAVEAQCRRWLRDRAAAEDAVQDVFCRLQRHLARVPGPPATFPWICKVVRNHCLNQLREARRRLAALPPTLAPPVAGDLAEQLHARDLIARAPEPLRAVAWLHHVEGRDQHEVAALVGVSRRTVLYRLAEFRALAAAGAVEPRR